jgi:hypothetical protein
MIPNMDQIETSLAGALFSGVQRRLLTLFYGQPDRSYYTNELLRLTATGRGGLQRNWHAWSHPVSSTQRSLATRSTTRPTAQRRSSANCAASCSRLSGSPMSCAMYWPLWQPEFMWLSFSDRWLRAAIPPPATSMFWLSATTWPMPTSSTPVDRRGDAGPQDQPDALWDGGIRAQGTRRQPLRDARAGPTQDFSEGNRG